MVEIQQYMINNKERTVKPMENKPEYSDASIIFSRFSRKASQMQTQFEGLSRSLYL